MTKGQLMQLVYTEEELSNIDTAIPREIYLQKGFNSWCHVMNYNEPHTMGRLENMFEIADQRDIEIPIPVTPEEMQVIGNIQSMNQIIHGRPTPFWSLRDKTVEQLREEQERLIPLYNNAIQHAEKKVVNIKFRGVDNFGRPVFKDVNSSAHYGSTDRLARHDETPEDLIAWFKDNIMHLDYFGTTFNCEPNGGMARNIKLNIVD